MQTTQPAAVAFNLAYLEVHKTRIPTLPVAQSTTEAFLVPNLAPIVSISESVDLINLTAWHH